MTAVVARPERVRLAGQRHQATQVTHQRLMLIMLLFLGVTVAIVLRNFYLEAFVDGSSRGVRADGMVSPRGDLVDRNGAPLSRTIEAWSIGVHPGKIIGD